MKEFQYVNAYGIHKKLIVNTIPKDGKYHVDLWSMDTGDWCGNGDMTKDELNDYLKHFGINDRI